MKDNKGEGEGRGGLKREGGAYLLSSSEKGRGLTREGGLNRGFTVLSTMTLMLFRVENDQLT